MEQTLQALVEILKKAVPTALFFIFLNFYLKFMLFGPIRKVLKEREELTEGTRKAAEASFAAANQKVLDYETKLRDARAEVYKEQEETRRKWLADQATQVAGAKAQADASLNKAKAEMAAETEAARRNLADTSAGLADQIATSILVRRPQ